jgi:putative sodium/glutamine symporter
MDLILSIITSITDFMWGYLILILLTIIGLFFTIKGGFMQLTLLKKIGSQLKNSNINISNKHLSPMQALLASLGGAVGVGSIAGMAIAINKGGVGAIFWLWVVAILGMALSMVENTLGQIYKRKNKDNNFYIGGPSFYIQNGLKNKKLAKIIAIIFSICLIVGYGITFNAIQANTIVESLFSAFSFNKQIVIVVLVILTALIIFGGIKRVAKVSFYVVPLMGIIYLLLTLCVIVLNIEKMPHVFYLIFSNAFGFNEIVSGTALGGVITAITIGAKRALFASESGLGSTPNITASSHVKHPINQGIFGAFAIFIISFLICTSSAFIVILGGQYGGDINGIALIQSSLTTLIGSWSVYFLFIAIFTFAFTSILGNYTFAEVNMEVITTSKIAKLFTKIGVILAVYLGGTLSLASVWDLGDFTVGFMVLINIAILFLLRKVFFATLKDYKDQLKTTKEPIFKASSIKELNDDTQNIWK